MYKHSTIKIINLNQWILQLLKVCCNLCTFWPRFSSSTILGCWYWFPCYWAKRSSPFNGLPTYKVSTVG